MSRQLGAPLFWPKLGAPGLSLSGLALGLGCMFIGYCRERERGKRIWTAMTQTDHRKYYYYFFGNNAWDITLHLNINHTRLRRSAWLVMREQPLWKYFATINQTMSNKRVPLVLGVTLLYFCSSERSWTFRIRRNVEDMTVLIDGNFVCLFIVLVSFFWWALNLWGSFWA